MQGLREDFHSALSGQMGLQNAGGRARAGEVLVLQLALPSGRRKKEKRKTENQTEI